MGKMRSFKAIQDFSIPIQGMEVLTISKGEEFLYDGITVVVRGEKVNTRALLSVIGDWIIDAKESNIVEKTENKLTNSRNITGGRIVENNDPYYDKSLGGSVRKSDDLNTLLKEYEKKPEKKVVSSEEELKEETEKESKYIQYEDQIVGKVKENKDTKREESKSKDKDKKESNKTIADSKEVKRINGNNKKEDYSKPKKLVVDKEAVGVVYKETNFKKENKKKVEDNKEKQKVVSTNIAVKKVGNNSIKKNVEVRSSTVSVEDQDTVVVSKVRKPEMEEDLLKETEGIISELTIDKDLNNDQNNSIIIDEDSIVEDTDIDLSNLLD